MTAPSISQATRTARRILAEELQAALPNYRVTGSAVMPSGITRPTVGVWQQSVERREDFGPDRVAVSLELWVLVGPQDPEKADDALDVALDDVLAALQPLQWVQWSQANRGVLAETINGYQITVTAVATIGD